jgi:hypothetical protein
MGKGTGIFEVQKRHSGILADHDRRLAAAEVRLDGHDRDFIEVNRDLKRLSEIHARAATREQAARKRIKRSKRS